MWIALAVVTFAVGQVYLFHCLRKLDCFLLQHSVEEEQESGGKQSN